jgi:2-amino-4-hydroxy-6-hydroxymethyldihydropteridine diphosphokinase
MAMEQIAYVAVGANVEPEKNIEAALLDLMRSTTVTAISTFYETTPIDRPDQRMFYNGVWKISTALSPWDLKQTVLRKIESDLGRVREEDRYTPRPIDLDLILFAEKVMNNPDLRLPDPDIRRRAFVAVPLLELDPNLVLPDTGVRLSSLPVARETDGLKALDSLTRKLKGFLEK